MRALWWKEESCTTLKKYLERRTNTAVNGVCSEDPNPRMTVTNFLQRVGSKLITFEDAFPPEKAGIAMAKEGKVC